VVNFAPRKRANPDDDERRDAARRDLRAAEVEARIQQRLGQCAQNRGVARLTPRHHGRRGDLLGAHLDRLARYLADHRGGGPCQRSQRVVDERTVRRDRWEPPTGREAVLDVPQYARDHTTLVRFSQ
jgi:hypothetical protein